MDRALVERARAGDATAFDELARERIDWMYRAAIGILGNSADARDATQDALVSAWRSLKSLRDPDHFEPWLRRITINAARMVARKRRVREIHMTPDFEPEAQAGSSAASLFDRAFEQLPVEQRALLLEHHLDGRSVADLAVELSIPEGTVKSRLHTARQALDRAFEEQGR
ncbi:MAG: RNA polymerase sigma factor [Candidatus Limnocylindrales bacterium]